MTTDERIEALEKAVGRQRITITALVLMAVAAAVVAVWPQSRDATFDTITAKSLQIVNAAGKIQVSLSADEDSGYLEIYNAAGERQASLGVNKTGGGTLEIYNAAGKQLAYLGNSTSDGGILEIYNAAGKRQVVLTTDKIGGLFGIYNAAGKTQVTLSADEDGGRLGIHNAAGWIIEQLP